MAGELPRRKDDLSFMLPCSGKSKLTLLSMRPLSLVLLCWAHFGVLACFEGSAAVAKTTLQVVVLDDL